MSASLSGKDTIVIAGRTLLDFADGDSITLEFPNDISNVKVGKNGNAVYAMNNSGLIAEVTLRLIRGGTDDKYLNALRSIQLFDFPSFLLLTGTFVKRVGDGNGRITYDTYRMNGGVFKKNLAAKENADGDTDQALVSYMFTFANAPRSIL